MDNPLAKLADSVTKIAESLKSHKETTTSSLQGLDDRVKALESKGNDGSETD